MDCGCKSRLIDQKLPVIWIIGGPGSGKNTQCQKIVDKYKFTHISGGDLLREEVTSGSKLSETLNAIMRRGELVSNEIIIEILKANIIKKLPTSNGFLIDGFPREQSQGELFERLVGPVDLILFFDAPDNELTARVLGRAQTSGRVDDNEESIKLRLRTFRDNNDLVIQKCPVDKLKRIYAIGTIDNIFKEVESVVDALLAKKATY